VTVVAVVTFIVADWQSFNCEASNTFHTKQARAPQRMNLSLLSMDLRGRPRKERDLRLRDSSN
jgi:hypothetical protein